jgi:hypothetical protein
MRRVLTFGLVALMLAGVPTQSFAATRAAKAQDIGTGVLRGVAKDSKGQNLAGSKIRIRNAGNGAVSSEVTSDATGAFAAPGLAPGSYVVEVVNAAGQVIGLSPAISIAAGATATVSVTATIGALAGIGATAGGLSVFGLGTAATVGVIGAAVTAAVVGIRAARRDASPSGQ